MHKQMPVAVELPDHVFAKAPEPFDAGARQLAGDKLRRYRQRPAVVTNVDLGERAPLEMGCQLSPDRLDFR